MARYTYSAKKDKRPFLHKIADVYKMSSSTQVPANNNIPVAMDLRDFYISTEWDVMAVPGVREGHIFIPYISWNFFRLFYSIIHMTS
jgi:hypothetical protein